MARWNGEETRRGLLGVEVERDHFPRLRQSGAEGDREKDKLGGGWAGPLGCIEFLGPGSK